MPTDLIEDCGDESYLVEIRDITLTPSFPERGKQLRWDMTARLREQVDLARVECNLQIKLGMVLLQQRTFTLPDLLYELGAKRVGYLHPPAGEWKQTGIINLPEEIPEGVFRIYLQSSTGEDEEKYFLDLLMHLDFRRR